MILRILAFLFFIPSLAFAASVIPVSGSDGDSSRMVRIGRSFAVNDFSEPIASCDVMNITASMSRGSVVSLYSTDADSTPTVAEIEADDLLDVFDLNDRELLLARPTKADIRFVVDTRTSGSQASVFTVTCESGPAPNVALDNTPIDSDGDGFFDMVTVRGDYDGNGTVETADIQAAIDDLTDTGAKYVYVEAGIYNAPTTGLVEASSGGKQDYDVLVALPSNTTLECAAFGTTVIRGLGFNLGQDVGFSVIGGDDGDTGNSNILIKGCEIDGGLTQPYDSSTPQTNGNRMGIRLTKCTDCAVTDNYVHDTFHAPIYLRESDRLHVLRNKVTDGSGYHDDAGSKQHIQPAIYHFIANSGSAVDANDGIFADNIIERVSTGITLRVGGANATARFYNFLITRNIITDANLNCMLIGGTFDTTISDNRCTRTDSIGTQTGVVYGGDDSNTRLQIVRNVISNAIAEAGTAVGIELPGLHEDIVVNDNIIDGTENVCFTMGAGVRNIDISGIFRNCGLDALNMPMAPVGEGWLLHDFVIDGWGRSAPLTTNDYAIHMFNGCQDTTIRNGVIRGSGNYDTAIRTGNSAPMSGCTFDNLDIDTSPKQWQGTDVFANAPFNGTTGCTDANLLDWGIITNAGGTTSVNGSGSTRNVVYCDGTVWTDWVFGKVAALSFGFSSATANQGNVFSNITIRNSSASPTGSSQDVFVFLDGAWTDNVWQNIRCDSSGDRVGYEGAFDCLDSTGATVFVRDTKVNISCGANRDQSTDLGIWTNVGGVCDSLP